ncbi:MAG TPA: fatty acid desaturase [Geminicoccaceae bacterium]|nr:fatty acid desaturase [Geminicoccaceae bacterium]
MALEFTHLDGHPVHRQRARAILAEHPEVRKLMGQNPTSALWAVGLVALQWAAAALLRDVSWLWIFVTAYLFGAFVNHALYVLIHECTHNLVFRKKAYNNYLGILCDFALAFPSAMAFRKYHLLHHQHLGEYEMDPDIVCHTEGRLVRDSAWRKALWVAFLGLSQALRPLKVKGVKALDPWIIANIAIIAAVDVLIVFVIGPKALAYLGLSTFFALGLHPVGGRWIQEHYETRKGQETYSYYGALNKTCFNMGYHNEHHDFAGIPWNNLPKLKRLAPDYYDGLASYRSWTGVLLKFIFDPSMSTYSRVVRAARERDQSRSRPMPAPAKSRREQDERPDDAAILDPGSGIRPTPASTGAR